MSWTDENIHSGHRGRMKEKFISHGARIFDTYELLEMLLYNVIPYKDTNPIAKRLLLRFGSLDGVFSAGREELLEIDGIGDRCADFLISVGELYDMNAFMDDSTKPIFDSFDYACHYFCDHFAKNKTYGIAAVFLDGRMRLLEMMDIPGRDLGSARVTSEPFVDTALRTSCTVMLLAHNHPFGPLYPSPEDMVTYQMIKDDLKSIGVKIAESFVVSGRRCIGIEKRLITGLSSDSEEYRRFIDSIREGYSEDE